MFSSYDTPNALTAAAAVLFGVGWLFTALTLAASGRRAQRRVATLMLELSGAQNRLEQAQSQMALLAHHDPLTGLLVLSELQRSVQAALALARRTGGVFGLVLVDLPGMKAVALTQGTDLADRVLAAFGQRLRTITRDMDTVARTGDDQFAVLIARLNGPGEIDIVVRKLRAECERTVPLPGVPGGMRVETCFGHACFPEDGADWTELMKVAEERLTRKRNFVRA